VHQFIAIEGNIGAGKTTLCHRLAQTFECQLILEQFDDNPFLPLFYAQPERYAFPVELFFMTERHKQLQTALAQTDMFKPFQVADYFFVKTLLFAKNNLNDEEYRLFQRLYQVLNATFKKPDLLVYLHRSVEGLLKNIEKRGREYEKQISPEYLQNIQEAYFEYFRVAQNIPILILEVEHLDFLNQEAHYQLLLAALQKKYDKGVHHLRF
jgi:deoxyguanosine kinase